MSLVVENGTGFSTAEAYVSVANADAYHTARGDTVWSALTTAAKEQALRLATDYIEGAYRSRWLGCRVNGTQRLSWPRYDVLIDGFYVESNIVPVEVANACAELAVKASAETLAPDLERGIKREKVGPLETEFDTFSPQAKRYRSVDMALSAYLKGSSAMAMLVRA